MQLPLYHQLKCIQTNIIKYFYVISFLNTLLQPTLHISFSSCFLLKFFCVLHVTICLAIIRHTQITTKTTVQRDVTFSVFFAVSFFPQLFIQNNKMRRYAETLLLTFLDFLVDWHELPIWIQDLF